MNEYARIQATPSTATMVSVAHLVPIAVICLAVPRAPSVVPPDVALLVIHGIARKIIGVMSVMMMQA